MNEGIDNTGWDNPQIGGNTVRPPAPATALDEPRRTISTELNSVVETIENQVSYTISRVERLVHPLPQLDQPDTRPDGFSPGVIYRLNQISDMLDQINQGLTAFTG